VAGTSEQGNETVGTVNCWESSDSFGNCKFQKKKSASCNKQAST
jgi:hypothetical protein